MIGTKGLLREYPRNDRLVVIARVLPKQSLSALHPFCDYAALMLKPLHFLIGSISLILGFVGVFLPLLPTTPFILLSAYCFSQSSPRLHAWLLTSRLFGNTIRNWEQHGAISVQAKRLATFMIVLLISYPLVFSPMPWLLKALAASTCIGVLIFIWTRPHGAI